MPGSLKVRRPARPVERRVPRRQAPLHGVVFAKFPGNAGAVPRSAGSLTAASPRQASFGKLHLGRTLVAAARSSAYGATASKSATTNSEGRPSPGADCRFHSGLPNWGRRPRKRHDSEPACLIGIILECRRYCPRPRRLNPMSADTHPVDEILPAPKLLTLGLQHVLVMYAGAVAVPLILGRALKMSPEDVAFLISADLFACGIATLIQSVGFPGVGIRLPVMMGVTFASVGPMLSMAASPNIGLLGIYGSVIAAGLFAFLAAPFISRLLPLFPPVVTGTIILVIGISLMRVGINWAGGGLPTLTKVVDGVPGAFPNPAYGQLQGLGIALFVLVVILGLIRWGNGVHRQRLGAARHHRRRRPGRAPRGDEFLQGGHRRLGRRGDAAAVRHAAIPPRPDRHHVHRHDRGDDRVGRHVPRARRDDRPQDRPSGTSPAACAPTASALSSAASSTPFPTRRSPRTSGWSASPASARAG